MTPNETFIVAVLKIAAGVILGFAPFIGPIIVLVVRRLAHLEGTVVEAREAASSAQRRSGRAEHLADDVCKMVKASTPVPFKTGDTFREYVDLPEERRQSELSNPRIVLSELQAADAAAKAKKPE